MASYARGKWLVIGQGVEEMNYTNTLIAVAEDCPTERAIVPEERAGKPTIATLQYQMLLDHPYEHTQEDVLFEVWWKRQAVAPGTKAQARKTFFGKEQPCLRTSPLPKKYGWGLLFDSKGRVALCASESKEYQQLLASKKATVLKAMRSSRGENS